MITLPEMISQISGFSSRDSEVFKSSVIALTSSLWCMNVLMATNFIVGLSKRDQGLYNDAKETLITEMKRLDYNLNDYELVPILNEVSPVLLQLNLYQKEDRIVTTVNMNLQNIQKDKTMDLDRLYAHIFKESSGICLQLAGVGKVTAVTVRKVLEQLLNELKLVPLMDLLDTYSKPVISNICNEIQIHISLRNPWIPVDNTSKGLFISAAIFNEYNCPFKLIATIQNIIFYIDQKCSIESKIATFNSIELPTLKNKLFGQSFQYIS